MTLRLRPLSPHVGVEVTGLDLRAPLDDAVAAQLQAAFRERHFLLIRQHGLGEEDQIRFSRLFGRPPCATAMTARSARRRGTSRTTGPTARCPSARSSSTTITSFTPNPLNGRISLRHRSAEIRQRHALPQCERDGGPALACAPGQGRGHPLSPLLQLRRQLCRQTGPDQVFRRAPSAPGTRSSGENPETGRSARWVVRISTVDFEGIARVEGEALIDERPAVRRRLYRSRRYWTNGRRATWSYGTIACSPMRACRFNRASRAPCGEHRRSDAT